MKLLSQTGTLLIVLISTFGPVSAQDRGGKPVACRDVQPNAYQNCLGVNCSEFNSRCFRERDQCVANCNAFPFQGCIDRCNGAVNECLSNGNELNSACRTCCDTAATKKCHTNNAQMCCAENFNQCHNP
jgi:hypothetical protein